MSLLDRLFAKAMVGTLVLAFSASLAFAESITLRPVADTTLFQPDPTNNLGGELTVAVGRTDTVAVNRGLFKFDVAGSIPSNAIITSASLTVMVVQVPSAGRVDSIFSLRRMLRAWGEGNKTHPATSIFSNGALATSSEATWIHRSFPDALWSVPGAAAPVDFADAISATNFIRELGSYTFSSTSSLVADVLTWLRNPAANFGWLMRSENEGTNFTNRRFASRENANNAPRLVVEYSLSQSGFRFDRITRSGTNLQLQFDAEAGKAYAVEFRDGLAAGSWLTLTNIAPQSAGMTITVSDAIAPSGQRYYRLRSP